VVRIRGESTQKINLADEDLTQKIYFEDDDWYWLDLGRLHEYFKRIG
jgi:hypothetical protein